MIKKILGLLSLICFLFLSTMIFYESMMDGESSSSHSHFLSFLFDFGPKNAEIIHPESMVINGEKDIYVGDKVKYTVTFNPSNVSNQRIEFSLSNNNATIDNNGNLLALKPGEVILSASSLDNHVTSSITINILAREVTSLSLNLEENLSLGYTYQYSLNSNLGTISNDDYLLTISNLDAISFEEHNIIRALKIGNYQINVEYFPNPALNFTQNITIADYGYQKINKFDAVLNNEYYHLENIPLSIENDGSDQNYFVYINDIYRGLNLNNINFSTIGKNNLKIVPLGNEDKVFIKEINILEVEAESIKINTSTLQYGKNLKLDYQIISKVPSLKVSYPNVKFESINEDILTIDNDGYLLGLSKGEATIKVTLLNDENIFAEKKITVTSYNKDTFNKLNAVLRKLIGHYGLFAATSFFGFLALQLLFIDRIKYGIIINGTVNLCYGFIAACISELIQVSAEGRGPAFNDVLIDTAGSLTSILILILIFYLIKKRLARKRLEN